MRKSHGAFLVVAGLFSAGCDGLTEEDVEREVNRILGSDYDISVEQEGPDMTANLGEQITRLEDEINNRKNDSAEDKQRYDILLELCKTEPGKACEPVARFPVRVPRFLWPFGCLDRSGAIPVYTPAAQCTMAMECVETPPEELDGFDPNNVNPMALPTGNLCVDVSKWLAQMPELQEYAKIAQAVAFDFSEHGNLKGAVKKVTINRITFRFKENSLTYAIPVLETYAGRPVSDADAQQPKVLIMDGRVTKFGTLRDIPAMFLGARNMQLEPDGQRVLSERILNVRATLAAQAMMVIPPETEAVRADNCMDPAHYVNAADYCESFPKPDGATKFSVEMAVTFTVNPSGN